MVGPRFARPNPDGQRSPHPRLGRSGPKGALARNLVLCICVQVTRPLVTQLCASTRGGVAASKWPGASRKPPASPTLVCICEELDEGKLSRPVLK